MNHNRFRVMKITSIVDLGHFFDGQGKPFLRGY